MAPADAPPEAVPVASGGQTATATDKRLPVTVFSGFLGAGKTTLLRHVLENCNGRRIALVVNDMNSLNVDAQLLRKPAESAGVEAMVELSNGCICCTLRDDLTAQLAGFAASGNFDCAVVESTGIGEPMPVAVGFVESKGSGQRPLEEVARLDTMVTLVDASSFEEHMASRGVASEVFPEEAGTEAAAAGKAVAAEEAKRGVADLLTQQVEFADVIVVNKADMVSSEKLQAVRQTCARLNPDAEVLEASFGKVAVEKVIATGRFSFQRAMQSPGWLQELQGGHVPETEEYGISSFCWRRARPLHPGRFHALLTSERLLREHCVVRSKGFIWLHTDVGHATMTALSCAGPQWSLNGVERWLAALPLKARKRRLAKQGMSLQDVKQKHQQWDNPKVGDRCQLLVVIGQRMQRAAVEAALDACLVDDEEWSKGFVAEDPFAGVEEDVCHHGEHAEEAPSKKARHEECKDGGHGHDCHEVKAAQ